MRKITYGWPHWLNWLESQAEWERQVDDQGGLMPTPSYDIRWGYAMGGWLEVEREHKSRMGLKTSIDRRKRTTVKDMLEVKRGR